MNQYPLNFVVELTAPRAATLIGALMLDEASFKADAHDDKYIVRVDRNVPKLSRYEHLPWMESALPADRFEGWVEEEIIRYLEEKGKVYVSPDRFGLAEFFSILYLTLSNREQGEGGEMITQVVEDLLLEHDYAL